MSKETENAIHLHYTVFADRIEFKREGAGDSAVRERADFMERTLDKTAEALDVLLDRQERAAERGAVLIGGPIVDTLTVKFWQDGPGWCAQIGPDIAEGVGGFGPNPLSALRDLCENIGRDEGHPTDRRRLRLR